MNKKYPAPRHKPRMLVDAVMRFPEGSNGRFQDWPELENLHSAKIGSPPGGKAEPTKTNPSPEPVTATHGSRSSELFVYAEVHTRPSCDEKADPPRVAPRKIFCAYVTAMISSRVGG